MSGKKLLVVESPAKIKTIAKFLGKDFKIMSTLGHIKDLPQKELGVSIGTGTDDSIGIDYVVLDNKDKIINELRKEASKVDQIFLAPDPDREGEIIAWHVAQEIEPHVKNPKKIYRIAFNEITKSAVEEAISHPSVIDLNKVNAQQARRVLDRWVGYEVSPILWRKISKGLSAGRVQSVALRLICDREEDIRGFKSEEYWSIEGIFGAEKHTIAAALTHKNKKKLAIKNKNEADALLEDVPKHAFSITAIKDSKRAKNPAPPFMTSTLQQAAYNQLGFSVDKTMMIAQKLYEGVPLHDSTTPVALITYMRTDSLRIADTAIKSVRGYITTHYGSEYVPGKSNAYSKGKAQDAHEAIRPIDVSVTPDTVAAYVEKDLARLYELIWKRFVACQMAAAQFAQRQVTIDGGPYSFRVTGSTLLFDGFLRVYNDGEDQDEDKKALPTNLVEKMALVLEKLNPKQHFTEPPARYTQASLVKELEKEGIGRPSTYATILKTIQARAYTSLDSKKRFLPTELGMLVTKLLVENLPKIMNIKFTAALEEKLDEIAQGALGRDVLLRDFYDNFSKDLVAFAGQQTRKALEQTTLVCPECKEGHLIIRIGKAGPFAGCSAYPTCTFTSKFERASDGTITLIEAQEPKLLDQQCPNCSLPLRQMQGRYGPFIACSGYPGCTYIHPTIASFACPRCQGKIVQKVGKGKKFWGCSTYPGCTFSIAGEIEQTACPRCASPYLLKRRTQQGTESKAICPSKECEYSHLLSEEESH